MSRLASSKHCDMEMRGFRNDGLQQFSFALSFLSGRLFIDRLCPVTRSYLTQSIHPTGMPCVDLVSPVYELGWNDVHLCLGEPAVARKPRKCDLHCAMTSMLLSWNVGALSWLSVSLLQEEKQLLPHPRSNRHLRRHQSRQSYRHRSMFHHCSFVATNVLKFFLISASCGCVTHYHARAPGK
jgi:hypothetical protein